MMTTPHDYAAIITRAPHFFLRLDSGWQASLIGIFVVMVALVL